MQNIDEYVYSYDSLFDQFLFCNNRIKFVFDENPFFDNLELVKEFQLGPNSKFTF